MERLRRREGKVTGMPPGQSDEPDPADHNAVPPSSPSRRPTFKSNVRWQLVASASQAILGALLLLLMGRAMGVGGFGVFSIVFGVVYVANALGEPRMQDVAAKQFWALASDSEDATRHSREFFDLLIFELVVKALPCAVLVAVAQAIAASTSLPQDGANLLIAAAIGLYLSKLGYGLSMGLLRVAGRTNLFAICAITDFVIRLFAMGLFALLGSLTVIEAIVIQSIAGAVSTMMQWVFVGREFPGLFHVPDGWRAAGYLDRIGGLRRLLTSNLALSASDLMSKDLDVAIMATFLPASVIGVYKMAKNVALLTWKAVDPFTLSLMPEVNRRVAIKDYSKLHSLIRKTTIGLLALTLVMSVFTIAGVIALGDIVFGPGYSDVPVLTAIMMTGLLTSAPLVWGHPLAVALGRAELAVIGSLVGTVLGLLIMLALAPRIGAIGASVAWAISFLSHFVYTAWASRKLLNRQEVGSHAQNQGLNATGR